MISILLFPDEGLAEPGWLTALGAVAVADVVEDFTGAVPRIKWPNDVRIDGRKIAGILVERGAGSVIGIGLNVNTPESDFPADLADSATSLRRLTGRSFDRSEVVRRLLRKLDEWYALGLKNGPNSLDAPINARSEHLGRDVRVVTKTETFEGRLEAIEIGRGLTLRNPTSGTIRIDARTVLAVHPLD